MTKTERGTAGAGASCRTSAAEAIEARLTDSRIFCRSDRLA